MTVTPTAQCPPAVATASFERKAPAEANATNLSKDSAASRDLAYFSNKLKDFAPTEGVSISPTLQAELPDGSTLKIETVPPSIQKYILAKENASRSVIDDYFFYLDASGIKEQAEGLRSGQDYNPDGASNAYFVRGLCEWFEGSDADSVAKSLEALVREYADKLKDGETPDMNQLQTKFHVSGVETTIGQIFQIRDTALAIRDVDYGSTVGTGGFVTFAQKGMMKATAEAYAATLPEGLGDSFAKHFTQLVEKNEVATMQYWKSLEYSSGRITKDFHSFLTDTSKNAYKLFSEIDSGGADFSSKLSQLMGRVSASGYYRPEDVNRYKEVLTNAYCQAINAIS